VGQLEAALLLSHSGGLGGSSRFFRCDRRDTVPVGPRPDGAVGDASLARSLGTTVFDVDREGLSLELGVPIGARRMGGSRDVWCAVMCATKLQGDTITE
jgi:hypothetical protein